MTTFLRTKRFRGDVRHGLSWRDVKGEIVKLGNKHFWIPEGGTGRLVTRKCPEQGPASHNLLQFDGTL